MSRSYWDRVAGEKRFSHPVRAAWLEPHLNSKSLILDYGCGYGRTLQELFEFGYTNVIGVDFSRGMLDRCRASLPGVMLVHNDGLTLPAQTGSVDAVFLFAVLTCIPEDEVQVTLITEARRVLRPNGLLYISDLLLNNDRRNLERYEQNAEMYGRYGVFKLPEGVVVRHHSQDWINELTKPFKMLQYQPFTVTTMNGNSSNAFQYFGQVREDLRVRDECYQCCEAHS